MRIAIALMISTTVLVLLIFLALVVSVVLIMMASTIILVFVIVLALLISIVLIWIISVVLVISVILQRVCQVKVIYINETIISAFIRNAQECLKIKISQNITWVDISLIVQTISKIIMLHINPEI